IASAKIQLTGAGFHRSAQREEFALKPISLVIGEYIYFCRFACTLEFYFRKPLGGAYPEVSAGVFFDRLDPVAGQPIFLVKSQECVVLRQVEIDPTALCAYPDLSIFCYFDTGYVVFA